VPADQFEGPTFDIRRRRLGIDGRFSHKPHYICKC
jgi:hypothetical protein